MHRGPEAPLPSVATGDMAGTACRDPGSKDDRRCDVPIKGAVTTKNEGYEGLEVGRPWRPRARAFRRARGAHEQAASRRRMGAGSPDIEGEPPAP